MGLYSNNDWRDYLSHKDGGKYDWSSGKNPSDYNHDYYEKHKAEILANRKSKDDAVRDFGGAGVGYKAKKDNTTGENEEDYENDDDWSDELTDEEKKNIETHNAQVDKNIAELTKTVNDYLKANEGKLSPEQVEKLKKDLATQTSIAKEQKINTKNSDDYKYVMDLRKKAGSNAKPASAPTAKSSARSKSTNTKPKKTDRKNTFGEERQANAALDEATRRYQESAANRDAYYKNKKQKQEKVTRRYSNANDTR